MAGIVGLAVARHLGATEYGAFSVLLAYVMLFYPLTQSFQGVVVREIATGGVPAGSLYRAVVKWVCGISLASFAAVLLTARNVIGTVGASEGVLLLLASQLLLRPLYVSDYFLQGHGLARFAARSRTIAAGLGGLLRVAMIVVGLGTVALATIAVVEVFIAGVLLSTSYALLVPGRRQDARRPLTRKYRAGLLRENLPVVLMASAVSLYMRVDQVMVGHLAGAREAGLYAVTVRLSEIPYAIPAAISLALAPNLARALGDPVEYDRLINRMFRLLSGISILVIAGMVAVAPLLSALLGSSFDGAASVLRIHVLSLLGVSFGVGQYALTVNERTYGPALIRTGAGALLNIGLNLLLIPPLGARGAAIATVISYIAAAFGLNWAFRRTRAIARIQWASLNPWSSTLVVLQEVRKYLPARRQR